MMLFRCGAMRKDRNISEAVERHEAPWIAPRGQIIHASLTCLNIALALWSNRKGLQQGLQ